MTRSLEFAIDLSIQVLNDPIPRVHRFVDSFRLPPLVYIDAFFETGGACYNLSTGEAAPWLANTSLTAANGIGGIIFLPQGQARYEAGMSRMIISVAVRCFVGRLLGWLVGWVGLV